LNGASPPTFYSIPRIQQGVDARSAPITPGKRRPDVDISQAPPELRGAAEGMEAMFLDYMMKVMRETVPKSDMSLDGPAGQIYRSMLDAETAKTAAKAGGVGLADQIVAYMMANRYTRPQGHGVPAERVQGGTHEGRTVGK
jgi:Rod binding domain-containing protein